MKGSTHNPFSQIIPFCERRKRLENAILKPIISRKQQFLRRKMPKPKEKKPFSRAFTVRNVVINGGFNNGKTW